MEYKKLEKVIGYTFVDEKLLFHSLIHSSYANERQMDKSLCNERIEFLGDAVLELVTSEYLFYQTPMIPEGEMTRKRASLVCEQTLALSAKDFGLEKYILLGKGEEITGGRERDSIISDTLESLIGAIYLDSGIENAKSFIHKFILNNVEDKQLFLDSKTALQEFVQGKYDVNVEYKLIGCSGPDHNKFFESVVMLKDKVIGMGKGKSKKRSEQEAAYNAIKELQGR